MQNAFCSSLSSIKAAPWGCGDKLLVLNDVKVPVCAAFAMGIEYARPAFVLRSGCAEGARARRGLCFAQQPSTVG